MTVFRYLISDKSLDEGTRLFCGCTCCDLGFRGVDHDDAECKLGDSGEWPPARAGDSVSSPCSSGSSSVSVMPESSEPLPKSIYLVGAPSTGKSTLLNALREAFPQDTPAIEEVARVIGKEMEITAADIMTRPKRCIEFQKRVLLRQYEVEKPMIEAGTPFLSDRSAVDAVVHAYKYCAKDQFRNLKKTREWKFLRNKYTDPKRSLFVVIEPNQFLMEDDQFRITATDWEEWLKFSQMFCDTLKALNIPYKVIPSDVIALDERVEMVRDWVLDDNAPNNNSAVSKSAKASSPPNEASPGAAVSAGGLERSVKVDMVGSGMPHSSSGSNSPPADTLFFRGVSTSSTAASTRSQSNSRVNATCSEERGMSNAEMFTCL